MIHCTLLFYEYLSLCYKHCADFHPVFPHHIDQMQPWKNNKVPDGSSSSSLKLSHNYSSPVDSSGESVSCRQGDENREQSRRLRSASAGPSKYPTWPSKAFISVIARSLPARVPREQTDCVLTGASSAALKMFGCISRLPRGGTENFHSVIRLHGFLCHVWLSGAPPAGVCHPAGSCCFSHNTCE